MEKYNYITKDWRKIILSINFAIDILKQSDLNDIYKILSSVPDTL